MSESPEVPTAGRDRPIRSFVRRAGRLTPGQTRALETLLPARALPATGPLDLDTLFGRRAPRVLEIGFGNGEALLDWAMRHPEHDVLGLEVHPPGVGHALLAAEAEGLGNLRIGMLDAVEVLARLPAASLIRINVYFPDPWHKKRHHKRRLIRPAVVARMAEVLAAGGLLHLATDWADYAEHMHAVLAATPALVNTSESGPYVPRPAERPQTRFERRGLRRGHGVYDLIYARRPQT